MENRYRVFWNAHSYSDGSGPARLTSSVIKAESVKGAEEILSERREREWVWYRANPGDPAYDDKPIWCDSTKRRHPYRMGMIHFGHTEELS